jgi:16S rRNA (cytosine1402-N4)-methyltransferase
MGQPAGPTSRAGRVTGSATGEPAGRSFAHLPVMLAEVVSYLAPVPPGVVLDATLGGAGHTRAILDAAPHLSVVGIDQDPYALEAARAALQGYGWRATVVRARFDQLGQVLDQLGIEELSGALFDLGVSSPQLDRPERGFSYREAGPLDMRMDPGQARSAADVVNLWPERELVSLLQANGEGRFARRIARAIVAARPIGDTAEFADTVKEAIPAAARRTGGHPARRVFQAVRIAVNEELEILPRSLDTAIDRLGPGGRCVVLSYHSGEDRIVKGRFRHAATGGCVCPPGMPCVCGAVPTVRLLTRGARRPSPDEVAANRRAESARLRVVERISPNAQSSGTEP